MCEILPPDAREEENLENAAAAESAPEPESEKDGKRLRILSIFGQIEGHTAVPEAVKSTKYEHILPLLAAAEDAEEIRGVLILLNTVGGDVEAGLAIAEMIAGMQTPTVSLILGGGHSIGLPLAVAAKKSFVVKSATLTLHPVRFNGLVLGVEQSFDYFRQMQDRIAEFVVAHSKITRESFNKLILASDRIANDMGTILTGKEAVAAGLIGKVGSIREALDALREMM